MQVWHSAHSEVREQLWCRSPPSSLFEAGPFSLPRLLPCCRNTGISGAHYSTQLSAQVITLAWQASFPPSLLPGPTLAYSLLKVVKSFPVGWFCLNGVMQYVCSVACLASSLGSVCVLGSSCCAGKSHLLFLVLWLSADICIVSVLLLLEWRCLMWCALLGECMYFIFYWELQWEWVPGQVHIQSGNCDSLGFFSSSLMLTCSL